MANGIAAVLVVMPCVVQASNHLLVTGGSPQPMGDTRTFSDAGGSFDVRWRHFNRGRTAYEFSVGYLQNSLSGVIPETIDDYEALVRDKNFMAQQQTQPGQGLVLAEYGTLEIYSVNANVLYRISRRARFSPLVSVGGGLYNWRVPFRIRFFNVPSFGENRAYLPAQSTTYRFVFDERFDEQVIDYTKHETSGGLNMALGANLRVMRDVSLEFEGRAHLIFSSGEGQAVEGIDNQDYVSPMYLMLLHVGLSYRF